MTAGNCPLPFKETLNELGFDSLVVLQAVEAVFRLRVKASGTSVPDRMRSERCGAAMYRKQGVLPTLAPTKAFGRSTVNHASLPGRESAVSLTKSAARDGKRECRKER